MVIGSIIPFAGSEIPDGFLVCDGSAISRTEYSDLFSVIGTTYGSGDGESTFNLPGFSGKTPLCMGGGFSIGSMGGEETHQLLAAEIPSHSHKIPSHTHGNNIGAKTPKFTHSVKQASFTYSQLSGGTNFNAYGTMAGANNGRTSAAMTRSTNLAISNHAAAACTMSGGIEECDAFDTESVGSGLGHNNMMPYLALTYLIYSPETVHEPGMVYYNGSYITGPSGGYFTGKGV